MSPIFADVLRPTRTHLFEDIARTAKLGYNHDGIEAIVLDKPYIVEDRDILKITRRPSLLDWLLRRPLPPAELARVHLAGGTFTWVTRGYAGTRATPWRRSDVVEVIGVAP